MVEQGVRDYPTSCHLVLGLRDRSPWKLILRVHGEARAIGRV